MLYKKLIIALCCTAVAPIVVTGCGSSETKQPTPTPSISVSQGNGTFTPTAKNIRVYRTAYVGKDGQQALMVYGVISDPFAGNAELYNSGSTIPNIKVNADTSQEVAES